MLARQRSEAQNLGTLCSRQRDWAGTLSWVNDQKEVGGADGVKGDVKEDVEGDGLGIERNRSYRAQQLGKGS